MSDLPESDLTYLQKFVLCVKNRGLLETLEIGFSRTFLPLYVVLIKSVQDIHFRFNNKEYAYCFHKYNVTWISERAVEIPIMLEILYKNLKRGKKVLEVGNVLKHYKTDSSTWPIVDKYERGSDVINADIVDYKSSKKFDLVISVSTMEHVGFDEEDIDSSKIDQAIEHVWKNLLKKDGQFIFSFPLGYNINLDKKVLNGKLKHVSDIKFLKRVEKLKWEQVGIRKLKDVKYNYPYAGGNSLVVVFIRK